MKTKRIAKWIFLALVLVTFTSCIDSFLEVEPKNLQTEGAAFRSYDNFLTYSWGLYNIFTKADDIYRGDAESPWMSNNKQTNSNIWANQKVTETTGNNEWNFDYVRQVNVMLDNIDKSEMTDADKEHWRSVGLFFRSFRYFKLLSMYGGVPWVEHVVSEEDKDVIYGKRDDRDVVAANILRDLKYAEQHIKVDGDGTNTINVHVIRALISRFGLFEGTWRKYHGLGDSETYLKACVQASEELMKVYPEVHNSYDELFNSQDLTGTTGIILFYVYAENILTHMAHRQLRASTFEYELCKEMVNRYLCTDGKPVSTSPLYAGDKTPYDEFRNRDHRLLFTVVPPSRIYKDAPASMEWRFLKVGEEVKIGATTLTVTVADSIRFREYIDLMAKISKPSQKNFPLYAWNYTLPTTYTPRFRNYPEGISPFSGQHGYWFYKYYNIEPALQATCWEDLPIFRIGEVMLNYAEAQYELELFDQNVADRTINKLRARVGVAKMVTAEIDESFDPVRDLAVAPLLWEIRRERTVELLGENLAFDDIRRWKKGEYFNKQPLGSWVKNAEYNNTLKIHGYANIVASKDKEGYVEYLDKPKGWLEHYYLYPVPMNQLVLNPQLEQNPGYKKP